MIQFLRFNKDHMNQVVENENIDSTEFHVITGKNSLKFFLKRVFYLFLFIYATFFLAVALPFVTTPFIPAYFIGSMATTILIVRFINHILQYTKYQDGSIKIAGNEIIITTKNQVIKIQDSDITYIEHNIFGNLNIKEKYNNMSFPLMLLKKEDREVLMSLFEDMAPNRTRMYRKVWDLVDAIAVALVLAVHIIQYVIQAYYIPTPSMEKTLNVGDHLFVEKLTYGPIIPHMLGMDGPIHLSAIGLRDIKRRDIIIFRPPDEKDKDYIKRCIAIPGDKFEIKNGTVYINDQKQDEPYAQETYYPDGITIQQFNSMSKDEQKQIIAQNRIINGGIVPKGKIVALGDNRTNSRDGRSFGYLEISRIKGKAFILYWNTDDIFNSIRCLFKSGSSQFDQCKKSKLRFGLIK